MSDENEPGDLSDLARRLAELVRDPARVDFLYRSLGEQCHRWRNMLNALKLSLHLARRQGGEAERSFWGEVDGRYRLLEAFLDDLQFLCRPTDLRTMRIPLGTFLTERGPAWSARFEARGGRLEVTPEPPPAFVDVDLMRMTRAFDAFVAWRAEAGPGRIRLDLRAEGDWARLEWREVGRAHPVPGPRSQPASLALPLMARVIALHGGDLQAEDNGAAIYRICMPLASSGGGAP